MKFKKILATSLLVALASSSLPILNVNANEIVEVQEIQLQVHTTSIEEIEKEFESTPNPISISDSNDEEVYSLVSEEDTIIPEELKTNIFYTTEDIQLKSSVDGSSEVVEIIPKGTEIELGVSGDAFANVTVNGKTGIVEVSLISEEKVEVEEVIENNSNAETKESVENVEIENEDVVTPSESEVVVENNKSAEKVKEKEYKNVSMYATSKLNVRKKSDINSEKVGLIDINYNVNGKDLGEWVEFEYEGKTSYVMKKYLSFEKQIIEEKIKEEPKKVTETKSDEDSNKSTEKEVTPVSKDQSSVDIVVNSALAQLGKKYVWASANPNVGFDCSGLMYYAFNQAGYKLNRSSYAQIHNGTPVTKTELQKGDLVFFGYNGRISHVGLYLGNNKMVHASTPSTGVIISNISSGYYANTYIGAARVIK